MGEIADRSQAVSGYRNNAAGGFWVAGATPEAADHALTASIPLSQIQQVAVLSEGAAHLPERYGWSWPRFMAELSESGPGRIIAATREAEAGTAPPRRRYPGQADPITHHVSLHGPEVTGLQSLPVTRVEAGPHAAAASHRR
ncbi:hypothetical protein OG455_28955 [Kitasatospora sp. NBC_01287]|uniref:hypothetical protein n=1 Tax=Kitasatospora sp. NBC_01287 TaxID=2903573 RepID=UPI00225BE1E3|nr:hypothetical protein [Kitasatospora sp. NBC_01287]MCX4749493.1 hypothetical protein [Kitasatospora sp. NBC_01287]